MALWAGMDMRGESSEPQFVDIMSIPAHDSLIPRLSSLPLLLRATQTLAPANPDARPLHLLLTIHPSLQPDPSSSQSRSPPLIDQHQQVPPAAHVMNPATTHT